eukprot:4230947-Ditylum_brightwellii.AAC.1
MNTPAWHLIGKPVTLVAEGKELVVCTHNGYTCVVDVKRTDTLSDVRSYIEDYFDDHLKPSNYLFEVGSVIISRSEEMNTPAWPYLGRRFVIVLIDSEGIGSSQSKATHIIEDV